MSIPKTIYQTYKTNKLPALTRWHIMRMKSRNPSYDYRFYDDQMVDDFIRDEFDPEVFELYKRINIGAAKADFFRYAVLFKKGGVYLDIDSLFLKSLDEIILPDDSAIISLGSHKMNYIQWALFFEAGHPFLKKTLELMLANLRENKYPYDVHRMTGPTVYSEAITACLKECPEVAFRQMDVDYDNKLKFSYRMSKFFLYGISRKNHWKTLSKSEPVLKLDNTSSDQIILAQTADSQAASWHEVNQ
jgi:inositol phosphorylceramide mannosyltransferase catalytic subunit